MLNPFASIEPVQRENGVEFEVRAPIPGEGLRRTRVGAGSEPTAYRLLTRLATSLEGQQLALEGPEVEEAGRIGLLVDRRAVPREVRFACPLPGGGPDPDPSEPWALGPGVALHRAGEALAHAPPGLRECARDDQAIAWVTDGVRQLRLPYWLPDETAALVERLLAGRAAASDLPSAPARSLAAAGILHQPARTRAARRRLLRRMARARSDLDRLGYAVLRDLLPPPLTSALGDYYRALRREGFLSPDGPARRVGHNEPLARWLHGELTPLVALALPEPVKPSYAFVSAYLPGAELPRHTDREQCEYTLSVTIDATPDPSREAAWPLYLESAAQSALVEARLAPGDGIVFRGRELAHQRTRLSADSTSTSVLWHFVPAAFSGPLD